MSKQLEGLALDEAVARVLGTTNSIDINPADVPYAPSGMRSPRYSTDAATLSEMLAWLRDSRAGLKLDITHYYTGASVHPPFYATLGTVQREGATLNEALCRLVLAVAATASQPEGKGETS